MSLSECRVLTDANIATMQGDDADYGLVPEDAVAIRGGLIDWAGPQAKMPDIYADWPHQGQEGRLITPALIDCHTHIVRGGDCAGEFEMRLNGATYEQIARAGGGIVSTVAAMRAASLDDLVQSALPRLDALMAEGVRTIEVKSGYDLDRETELRAARRLGQARDVRIVTRFLGALATPPEYSGRDDAYIDEVCIPALRAAHAEGLVDAVDGFCMHGVPMALATDCNPGSAPLTSLLLAMNMGCTLFWMTPQEALAGVTCHAARALGLRDTGRVVAGLRADLAIWDVRQPAELSYRIGYNPLHLSLMEGQP
jgi:imidazolonepropionase-like amidohydrolase